MKNKTNNLRLYVSILLTLVVLTAGISTAIAIEIPVNDKAKDNSQAPGNSPIGNDWTIDVPVVRSIDWATGDAKVEFVHYKEAKGVKGTKVSACYSTFAKWPGTPVNYVINPTNSGLDETFVLSAISASAEAWDSATTSELFNPYSVSYTLNAGSDDNINVIDFGPYDDPNVIAVTYVWYNIFTKTLYQTDMRFNTAYSWGDATVNSGVMDPQNIGTHEFGHVGGMNDIYKPVCGQVTMYGYSSYGETKKRTLEAADIAGIKSLYG